MRKSHFTEEQIIGVLKESEAGMAMADLCRKHGVSQQTFYRWKAKYGSLEVSQAPRLRELEEENRQLKHALAESMLDVRGAQGGAIKKVVGLQARREAVTVAMAEAGLSQRRACGLIPLWRGTMRYQARPASAARRMSNSVCGCAS